MPFKGLLSVVIPVYRSEAYLERTVREVIEYLEVHGMVEIVLVNDGSPDGVQSVIERLRAADSRIRYVELGANRGQHRATLQGFAVARGDVIVTLDDDGQNPPSAALAVAGVLQAGDLDVVYGRFETTQQSWLRRLSTRINRWLSRAAIGNRAGISISNVRALRGDLARALAAGDTPYTYLDALIFHASRRIDEVSVQHRPRGGGRSSYRIWGLMRLWLSHMTSVTSLPLKVATVGCFGASGLGFLVGLVELLRVLIERQAPPGWLSLFCALTFLFSLLFVFLGIVSAYVGRMYVSANVRGFVWVRSSSESAASRQTAAQRR